VEQLESVNDAIELLEKMASDSYHVLLLDNDLDLSGSQDNPSNLLQQSVRQPRRLREP
jgi:hypothetical protein